MSTITKVVGIGVLNGEIVGYFFDIIYPNDWGDEYPPTTASSVYVQKAKAVHLVGLFDCSNANVVISDTSELMLELSDAISEYQVTLDEKPYITKVNVTVSHSYNPSYGDDRACICGHPYYRHFDTYASMSPAGCKYCGCSHFIERPEGKEITISYFVDEKTEKTQYICLSREEFLETAKDVWVEKLSTLLRVHIIINGRHAGFDDLYEDRFYVLNK